MLYRTMMFAALAFRGAAVAQVAQTWTPSQGLQAVEVKLTAVVPG